MTELKELLLPEELRDAESLLRERGLSFPDGITFGLGAYEGNALSGVGFLSGDILCGIGVDRRHEGSGLSTSIIGALLARGRESGIRSFRLFTKPVEAAKFESLGFSLLAMAKGASLLEIGFPDYRFWIQEVKERVLRHAAGFGKAPERCAGRAALGAVVMNANPFTRGHRHLVEKALEKCSRLLVFVVQEEASVFPFPVRLRLVKEGLNDLERALVLPGGPYMVSRASFPAYFTGSEEHARVHAGLDCAMFAVLIASDLGITLRCVGSEPYCPVTAAYNSEMLRTLPAHGVACLEIPRLCLPRGEPVSASLVRELLRNGAREDSALEAMLPESTLAFLRGAEADSIVDRLQAVITRH